MKIGLFKTMISSLVSEHISEVMLGIDWLTSNGVVWEFERSRIIIGGKFLRLYARSGDSGWCRRISLQQETVLQPRSETDVAVKVLCRPWKDSAMDMYWSTEPTTIRQGVYVSRTLLPIERFSDVCVRVANVLSTPVTLAAGIVVADLEPVCVFKPSEVDAVSIADDEETVVKARAVTSVDDETPEFIEKLKNGVHPSLPESTVLALESLLVKYSDVFSCSEYDLGLTGIVTHRIDTEGARPIRQQLRRYPPAHVEAISQHVDNMLNQG
jgi:hypothetical protein